MLRVDHRSFRASHAAFASHSQHRCACCVTCACLMLSHRTSHMAPRACPCSLCICSGLTHRLRSVLHGQVCFRVWHHSGRSLGAWSNFGEARREQTGARRLVRSRSRSVLCMRRGGREGWDSADSPSPLPKGQKRTVCFTPLSGLLSQDKFLPIRYCPIQLEFELVGSASDAVQGDTVASLGKSESFLIDDVQLKCDLVQLDNSLDNEYASKHRLEATGRLKRLILPSEHLPIWVR